VHRGDSATSKKITESSNVATEKVLKIDEHGNVEVLKGDGDE